MVCYQIPQRTNFLTFGKNVNKPISQRLSIQAPNSLQRGQESFYGFIFNTATKRGSLSFYVEQWTMAWRYFCLSLSKPDPPVTTKQTRTTWEAIWLVFKSNPYVPLSSSSSPPSPLLRTSQRRGSYRFLGRRRSLISSKGHRWSPITCAVSHRPPLINYSMSRTRVNSSLRSTKTP